MCIDHPSTLPRRARGLTLIELVMFIVIVSVAIAGVLSVMNITSRHSADPQLRKQALAIAEGLLEEVELARFTYCDPAAANATTAAAPADCVAAVENAGPESGNARPFDNVNDYVAAYNEPAAYTASVDGTPFPAGYAATVTISPQALNGIASGAAPAAAEVLHIAVTVSYGGDSITLDGYRTRYDPNGVP